MNKSLFPLFSVLILLSACSVQKRVGKVADKYLLKDSTLATAHVGIALYNTAGEKFVYNHDGKKYFVPASNTKILTCYAAMKYLGDSLVGLRYYYIDTLDFHKTFFIQPTADPTFFHPDFKSQPVVDWLKKNLDKKFYLQNANWQENAFGKGWNWDDYQEDYMAERSEFPIYGNVIRLKAISPFGLQINPKLELQDEGYADMVSAVQEDSVFNYSYKRDKNENIILWQYRDKKFSRQEIPFITSIANTVNFLKDTMEGLKIEQHPLFWQTPYIIHSQPTDSLLKIMMHRSDNFFAEQALLMVSNELLGVMNDERIIDTLLKTDFKDLPQKPNWVDGSGLSHYNLITPQDEVKVLEKMKNNFNWNRITTIFSTGGTGTLRTRYKKYVGKIYAKTGSLSDVIALSGFITTNKNHSYIFSVMINNNLADETQVRDKIEKFISTLIEKF